jgi:hypothetical protein
MSSTTTAIASQGVRKRKAVPARVRTMKISWVA